MPFQGWETREEEDTLLIERILLLIRNILHVPADPKAEKVWTTQERVTFFCYYKTIKLIDNIGGILITLLKYEHIPADIQLSVDLPSLTGR